MHAERTYREDMLTDFHTHILPGIDDGSQDLDMTGRMLRAEKKQSVDLIVATPHFYADQMAVDSFLENRTRAMEATARMRQASKEALPEIVVGAEVYYFQGMGRAEAMHRLTVADTDTILVELPFEQWDEAVLRDVESLIRRQRLNVVLAHIERYPQFQKDRDVWKRLMALPVTEDFAKVSPSNLLFVHLAARFALPSTCAPFRASTLFTASWAFLPTVK